MKILKSKSYKDLDDSLTPEQHAEVQKMMAEARAAVPEVLLNLVWENGQMYYVDDNGNRIDKLVDIKAVTKAMINQMPKTPLKVNDVDVDRKEILKNMIGSWTCQSCLKESVGLGACTHCGSNAC